MHNSMGLMQRPPKRRKWQLAFSAALKRLSTEQLPPFLHGCLLQQAH